MLLGHEPKHRFTFGRKLKQKTPNIYYQNKVKQVGESHVYSSALHFSWLHSHTSVNTNEEKNKKKSLYR